MVKCLDDSNEIVNGVDLSVTTTIDGEEKTFYPNEEGNIFIETCEEKFAIGDTGTVTCKYITSCEVSSAYTIVAGSNLVEVTLGGDFILAKLACLTLINSCGSLQTSAIAVEKRTKANFTINSKSKRLHFQIHLHFYANNKSICNKKALLIQKHTWSSKFFFFLYYSYIRIVSMGINALRTR